MKIVTKETLHFHFKNESSIDLFKIISTCCICMVDVTVEVVKTEGGFGLLGGVLYESNVNTLTAKCIGCARANKKLLPSLTA